MSEEEIRLAVKNSHRHEPDPGVLISRKGEVADLLNHWDYPITSRCTICGEKIRTRIMFIDNDWYVVEGESQVPGL